MQQKKISILVVDDDMTHRFMLKSMFAEWGWTVTEADDGETAVAAVGKSTFDAVLMDVRMARMDGITAFSQIHAMQPKLPVVIMTAYSSVDAAVEAIKNGAHDYLTKPLDFERLRLTLTHSLEQNDGRQQDQKPNSSQTIDTSGIIGHSKRINELLEMISYVGPTEATVLIAGESGTGKELIATALHRNSLRKDGPLIKVNCAALAENLLESELFGHEKGAFTGADRRREGKFMQAQHGTIFLDEIGETSPAMQVKLLRVLQEHEIQRVGGQETIKIDARVIAAGNRVLEDEVKKGTFREDLYYRLNVVTLHVPALRDRHEDIPLLVDFFIRRYAEKNRRNVSGITPGCMALLTSYPWPGNVRELENAIERGIILMRGDILDETSLPMTVRKWAEKNTPAATGQSATPPASLEEAEKMVLVRTLTATSGNKSEAARRLNITRKTLLSKMNKYGIIPESDD